MHSKKNNIDPSNSSMHSAIEYAKKHDSIFLMHDWKQIFKRERTKNKRQKEPYNVTELKYADFLDLQELSTKLIKNRNKDEDVNKVDWLKIKCLKYEKMNPGVIFYKYTHSTDFKKLDVKGKSKRRSKPLMLKALHNERLPISDIRKANLVQLCDKHIIPEELHDWYKQLPSTSDKEVERAPEAAAEDESDLDEEVVT